MWYGFLEIDDAAEDDGEDGREILLLVRSNGQLDEAFGYGDALVKVRCFQDRPFAPEAELRRDARYRPRVASACLRTTLSRNFM